MLAGTLAVGNAFCFQRVRTKSVLDSVPGDILLEIVKCLPCLADTLHFSLTSSFIFLQVIPALYASIDLSSSQCALTLGMLSRRSDIARHVRELIVRPDYDGSARSSPVDGYIVSAAVRQAAPKLDALHTFIWDGVDMPPYDDMWFALRICCPQLRTIGTTIGPVTPNPRSHLFDFSDLKGFSLTLRSGFYSQFDVWDDLPPFQPLWDMVMKRCPNLQVLTVDGISSRPTDARLLYSGRWPKLRKLVLGPVLIPTDSFTNAPSEKSPFVAFLESHKNLQSLHLTSYAAGLTAAQLAPLEIGALPRLTEFCGTLTQLQALPRSVTAALLSVRLPEPMLLREVTPLTVASVLRNLPSLTTLSMNFVLQSGYYDNVGVLRSIVSVCPFLRDLEITCGSQPAFYLESFSRAIRSLQKLSTLTLTTVKVPGDEPMIVGAARIALSNPRLSNFTISYISRHIPLSYRHNHSFDVPNHAYAHETGTYEVICDKHGLPIRLAVYERRVQTFVWWWRRVTRKRYLHDLRPVGHPDVKKRHFAELLTEKGPAGEETRLMFFCCLLVIMAIMATFRGG